MACPAAATTQSELPKPRNSSKKTSSSTSASSSNPESNTACHVAAVVQSGRNRSAQASTSRLSSTLLSTQAQRQGTSHQGPKVRKVPQRFSPSPGLAATITADRTGQLGQEMREDFSKCQDHHDQGSSSRTRTYPQSSMNKPSGQAPQLFSFLP